MSSDLLLSEQLPLCDPEGLAVGLAMARDAGVQAARFSYGPLAGFQLCSL